MITRLAPIIIGGRVFEVELYSDDGCFHSCGRMAGSREDLEDILSQDPPPVEPRPERSFHLNNDWLFRT